MPKIPGPLYPPPGARPSGRPWAVIFTILLVLAIGALVYANLQIPEPSPVATNVTNALDTNATRTAMAETCPTGFVLVPGNPLYKTPDFCVMKYEAKCANATDPTLGLQPAHGSACSGQSGSDYYGVYKNSGAGCGCTGSRTVVSTASGFPIAYIPQSDATPNNAKAYCTGQGWHLITNAEWMTIARNVEQVDANWCDRNGTHCGATPGAAGKILSNGHNDARNEVAASADSSGALVAGTDNQPCYGTTTDGSSACGGASAQRRTLTLSNGQVVWDLAGNVWEWTDNLVARKDEPKSATNGVRDVGWKTSDFAPGSNATVLTDFGQGPEMGFDAMSPTNRTWNASNGIGRVYHYSSASDTDTTLYAFIRGGNWRHGYDDGAFNLHLSPPPDRTGINDVGFRCVTTVR